MKEDLIVLKMSHVLNTTKIYLHYTYYPSETEGIG